MNKILDFIEDHKYGIIVALVVHVGLFIYFQLKTYEVAVPYEPWSFQGRNIEAPDDIEITAEQIITDEEQQLFEENEEVTSFVKSEHDSREKSFEKDEVYTSYEGDAYSNIKSFESEVIEQLESKRKDKTSDGETKTDLETEKEEIAEQDTKNDQQKGSEKAVAGKTMVSYDLKGRHPLNNNDWHVRNPGYTCGNVNGTVVVRIKVNQNGDVTNAKYIPERSLNANQCMSNQAEKYALMSRFNFDQSKDKTQEGYITYKFIYRK